MKTLSEWQGSLYIVFCILTFCVGITFWRKDEEIKEIPRFPKAPCRYLYLKWEEEVDNIYHSQRISDEKFLRSMIFKFEGVILT